jgi:hypothetical protein
MVTACAVMACGHAVISGGHLDKHHANGHVGMKDNAWASSNVQDKGHVQWRISTTQHLLLWPIYFKVMDTHTRLEDVSNGSHDPVCDGKDETKADSSPERRRSPPPASSLRKKSSGYRGVTAAASSGGAQAWRARIRFSNKVVNLGRCVYI